MDLATRDVARPGILHALEQAEEAVDKLLKFIRSIGE